MAAVAAALGRPLHPHQRLIADVAGEVLDDGTPAYPDVGVVMPRRGGKTVLVLARAIRELRRSPQQRAFYTSQSAEDGLKVLRDEWSPLVESSPLRHVLRFRYARGDAGMYVRIGRRRLSRLEVFTPNANALHGRDADLTVVDEAWSFSEARGADIDAGIRPARWARPRSQLWRVSAGGTPDSGYLHQLIDAGRAQVPGLAYFEWSADPDDPGYDPRDERLWLATHPGIGTTCSLAVIRADAARMRDSEVERAVLCVWRRSVSTSLLAGWSDLLAPTANPRDTGAPLTLAFDVNPDRTHAAIAAAAGGVAELVDYRPGTGWLSGRVDQLATRYGANVVRDRAGPAGVTTLADETPTHDATAAEVGAACAWLVDTIRAGALAIRPHPALSLAFAGARAANRGDGQTIWVRRDTDADLCPLYALTLAAWASATEPTGAIY